MLFVILNRSARFFFRDPGTVSPGAEVLKPFSTKTWQATIAIGLTLSLAIKLAYWIEYKFFRTNVNYSGFTSIVIVISAFAQQGNTLKSNKRIDDTKNAFQVPLYFRITWEEELYT